MKLTLILLFITMNALASGKCEIVGQGKYDQIVTSLVMEGKGVIEVNDILQARMHVCQDKCQPPITGLCMLIVSNKKNENGH